MCGPPQALLSLAAVGVVMATVFFPLWLVRRAGDEAPLIAGTFAIAVAFGLAGAALFMNVPNGIWWCLPAVAAAPLTGIVAGRLAQRRSGTLVALGALGGVGPALGFAVLYASLFASVGCSF